MTGSSVTRLRSLRTWLPGYLEARRRNARLEPVKRIWVTFADHFEPGWRGADRQTAMERVRRWVEGWPSIARRHVDSAGRPACYTFFYPEEQYDAAALSLLSTLQPDGLGDVEVHLHHDGDSEQRFLDRMGTFIERLHHHHGLLRRRDNRIAFGFIHGNWALDNSLPDGRHCGLNNEISLLARLGCYADFTAPAAPSPAQTRMVNTIYWATDDPATPKSHDRGVPVRARGVIEGDLMIIPGPLGLNLREWGRPFVPRLEVGELGSHCRPTRHRATLWRRLAPRIGGDLFLKLFAHGAPEKNAMVLLADDGALDRTLKYLREESSRLGAQIVFASAFQMWSAIDALRRGMDPLATTEADRRRAYAESVS